MSELEQLLKNLEVDARHDLIDVHVAGGMLTGFAETRFREPLHALAAEQGLEAALRFPAQRPGVACFRAGLLAAPLPGATQLNEVLPGDAVELLDSADGFTRVRTLVDDYLGWLPPGAVVPGTYAPTHTVTALRAHAFGGPRVQAQRLLELSWGTGLRVRNVTDGWAHVILPDGRDAFVPAPALTEGIPEASRDFVAHCRSLLHAPYVWGGNTAWGLDCSGLTQLVHAMAGAQLPRDADEQFRAGRPVELSEAEPGDAACYRGHIGIITGPETMIHATGRTMDVREDHVFATEVLREAFLGVVRFG